MEFVRALYQALESSNRAAYRELLDPEIDWQFMAGFPHGGARRGVDAVIDQTFVPLMTDFDTWHIEVEEILEAGGPLVAVGRYRARARTTGREVVAGFCHILRLRNERIVRVEQFTDTLQFALALDRGPGEAAPGLARGRVGEAAPPASGERFDVLAHLPGCAVEEITSSAQPGTGEQCQDHDEWVALIAGTATLQIEGKDIDLTAGDWVTLPAGTRHRVVRTSRGARWLAVHGRPRAAGEGTPDPS